MATEAGHQLALLERRWASAEASRLAQLDALYLRAAALAAAVHHSRCLARRCGWAPWRTLLQQAHELEAAALSFCARQLAARALEAWKCCRQAAAWRAVASEACGVAAARQQRQRALLARGMAALQQHTGWARGLVQLHNCRLAFSALRGWHEAAAETSARMQVLHAAAARHSARSAACRALEAWRCGAVRCKRERVVASRREQRWGAVQQYLVEHRAAKQVAAASGAGAGSGAGKCWQGSGNHGNNQQEHSLSSAENSFDPNSIFFPPGPPRC